MLSDRFLSERVHVPFSIVYSAREEVGERPKRERAQGEVVRGDGEAEPLDEFAEIVWTQDVIEEESVWEDVFAAFVGGDDGVATRGGAGRRRSRIRPSPAEEDFVRYDVDERAKYGEDETEFE